MLFGITVDFKKTKAIFCITEMVIDFLLFYFLFFMNK